MGEAVKLVREVIVENDAGMHARVASMLVQKVKEFSSEVTFRKGKAVARGDSMIDLLSFGAGKGTHLMLEISGEDADDAMEAITGLFARRFYED